MNRRTLSFFDKIPVTFTEPLFNPITDSELLRAWEGIGTKYIQCLIDEAKETDSPVYRVWVRVLALRKEQHNANTE